MMSNTIRRTALAALAVATVALTGCASTHNNERRLALWSAGESRDLVLIRAVSPLSESEFDFTCKENKLSKMLVEHADINGEFLSFVKNEVCPRLGDWKSFRGFLKSDFGQGNIIAGGLIPSGVDVKSDDIVEVKTVINFDGRLIQYPLVTRIVRKSALKERDPTCYWDGQSGALDSFATGGVVCPAEGWDWRNQKWAKK